MLVLKTKFDQGNHLKPGERGVCNALVLDWLANGGRNVNVEAPGVMERARRTHAAGVRTVTFAEYGLGIHSRSQPYLGSTARQIDQIKKRILDSPMLKFLIGFDGSRETGHTIGLVKCGVFYKAFDPNNGYYEIAGDTTMTWLFNKLLSARIKHNYREFLVYELLSIRGARMPARG